MSWRAPSLLFLAIVAATAASPVRGAAAQSINFFRIATGTTVDTYFPIGRLIASAISNPPGSRRCEEGGSCGVPGLIAIAQSTEGARENIALVAAGKVESGLSQADLAYWAFHGEESFKKSGAVSTLRTIASLYPEAVHIVVRRDSGIKSIRALKGRKISLGPVQSGTAEHAGLIFKAFGLDPKSFKRELYKPSEAARRLREGRLDAMVVMSGAPVAALVDLARENIIDILPIQGPEVTGLLEKRPFFTRFTIPRTAYASISERQTIAVAAVWLTSTEVPADIVYAITKSLWHRGNRKVLDGGHPDGRKIRLKSALDGVSVPLHDGAARFYREIGQVE